MELVDTHCHVHFPDYGLDVASVIADAKQAGVAKMICVGCTLEDSRLATKLAASHEGLWASVGLHPHEAVHYVNNQAALEEFKGLVTQPKVIAIGECGLDYYYNHSPHEAQIEVFRFQLSVARAYNLPVIFHVREAFEDFWSIVDEYSGIRGVVHSFTASSAELQQALKRNFYIGLNGIMTFTKDPKQRKMATEVPLDHLVLETDAPFLTPKPFRGKICEPKHVAVTAEFLAGLRKVSLQKLAERTSQNAAELFKLESK